MMRQRQRVLGGAKLATMAATLTATMTVAGCGGDDGASIDAFLGAWTVATTTTVMCGKNPTTSMSMDTYSITKGMDSLIAVAGQCTLKMDAKGDVATLRAGQTCTLPLGSATVNSGKFTLMGI